VARGQRSEQGEVAAPLRTKAKVPSDEQPRRAQAMDDVGLDETLSGERRQRRVEARHVYAAHARGGHQLQLVAQPREPRRCGCRGEKLARMRLEGEHASIEPQFARARHRAREHRLMAAVHAVEIANGERQPLARGRD
jgi:hypothetical protein